MHGSSICSKAAMPPRSLAHASIGRARRPPGAPSPIGSNRPTAGGRNGPDALLLWGGSFEGVQPLLPRAAEGALPLAFMLAWRVSTLREHHQSGWHWRLRVDVALIHPLQRLAP